MFKNIVFKILWHFSWRLGYVLQEKKIKAIEAFGDDPRGLPYLKHLPYAIVNLPTDLGIGLRFYPLSGNTYHPFVLALKNQDQLSDKEAAFNVLKAYSQLVNLKTGNDFLGFSQTDQVFSSETHPYEYTYPWSPLTPQEVRDFTIDDIRRENDLFRFSSNESLDLANVSDRKVRIETERLLSLKESIKKNGFQQQNEDVLGCFVLVNGNKWKWYVQGGQHRAAVLASLGYHEMPVYVRQIIRREDVCFWPNVQFGTFTEKQALAVFDRLFDAEPPPVADDWIEYVNMKFQKDINKNLGRV